MIASDFTHTYLKNEIVISAEKQCPSQQSDNTAETSPKKGAFGKFENTTSKTDENDVDKNKNDASTAPSNDDMETAVVTMLTTQDEGKVHPCKTLIVYIKSMGVGWFSSATLLALIGYVRYVRCLSMSETSQMLHIRVGIN